MNYKNIFFYLGISLIFFSIFPILNIIYSIYFNFFLSLNDYILTLFISLTLGLLFLFMGYKNRSDISIYEQITFIIIGYFFLPVLISIPYMYSIYDINFLNAYFESVSGFTTTGFSIFLNIDNIDEPLVLWRSTSQWYGGLFFLIITIGAWLICPSSPKTNCK